MSLSSYNTEINIFTYILVQTVHVIHTSLFFWLALTSVYPINLFYCTIILFFTKRFQHLSKQLNRLDEPAGSSVPGRINNRKLSRLMFDYNQILHEMMEMNQLFKVSLENFLIKVLL